MTAACDSTRSGELIFLEPVFLPRVWGGTRLRDLYGYDLPADLIGECLAISARPEGDCRVERGPFKGTTLSALWSEHPELFGRAGGDAFPLQIKILDATQDLSVQVHPDAAYAARHEGVAGKNECWYVIRASNTGQVVLGHEADTREQFARLAGEGRWGELLRIVEMAEGSAYLVPGGTVHAILAGSLIYEVQQSSDVTYRLYDYDRLDRGAKRPLHVAQVLDVVTVPSAPVATVPVVTQHPGATQSLCASSEYFSVSKWEVEGTARIPTDAAFLLVSALAGSGTVNGVGVTVGDHFVVPGGTRLLEVTGPLTLMVTAP
jgi:mannose-6-phosphate isomerase